jgi:hypothetical protein
VKHGGGKQGLIVLDARIADPKAAEKPEYNAKKQGCQSRFSDKVSPFSVDSIIRGRVGFAAAEALPAM